MGGPFFLPAATHCRACARSLTLSDAFSILGIPDLAGCAYLIDFSGNVWGLKRSLFVWGRLRDPPLSAAADYGAASGGRRWTSKSACPSRGARIHDGSG